MGPTSRSLDVSVVALFIICFQHIFSVSVLGSQNHTILKFLFLLTDELVRMLA